MLTSNYRISGKKIRGMPDFGHTPFTNAKIGARLSFFIVLPLPMLRVLICNHCILQLYRLTRSLSLSQLCPQPRLNWGMAG